MCTSTAYQGAKQLMYMIWMSDAIYGVCSLNHDLRTSLGLSHTPNFLKIHPHLHMHNSVMGHPCAHSYSISRCSNTLYTSNIDVGCSLKLFAASTMTLQHSDSAIHPIFQKSIPTSRGVYWCKGAPICSSTASQGAKTVEIYDMDVGCTLKLLAASTTTLEHHS